MRKLSSVNVFYDSWIPLACAATPVSEYLGDWTFIVLSLVHSLVPHPARDIRSTDYNFFLHIVLHLQIVFLLNISSPGSV